MICFGLQASSITTPNGSLEVCYDERGYQYKVPQYCVSNPSELTSSTPNENSVASNSNGVLPSLTASATVIPANEGVYKARAAAIATKSSNNSPINVRVRINPGRSLGLLCLCYNSYEYIQVITI